MDEFRGFNQYKFPGGNYYLKTKWDEWLWDRGGGSPRGEVGQIGVRRGMKRPPGSVVADGHLSARKWMVFRSEVCFWPLRVRVYDCVCMRVSFFFSF